jgi:hypothetical protein
MATSFPLPDPSVVAGNSAASWLICKATTLLTSCPTVRQKPLRPGWGRIQKLNLSAVIEEVITLLEHFKEPHKRHRLLIDSTSIKFGRGG